MNLYCLSIFCFSLFHLTLSYSQQFSFDQLCNSQGTFINDGFRKGCGYPWTAGNGTPSIYFRSPSEGEAVLKDGESIVLTKDFDTCTSYTITIRLKLASPAEGQLNLNFLDISGKSKVLAFKMRKDYATGWTSLYVSGVRLPVYYHTISLSFAGSGNELNIDQIELTTEPGEDQELSNLYLLGRIEDKKTVTLNNTIVAASDSLTVLAQELIILEGETILSSESEILLQTKPLPPVNKSCKEEKSTGFAIYNFVSADDDGVNDTFYVEGLENYQETEVAIVNKLGRLIYHSSDYRNEWTGKNEPAGVYTFQLRIKGHEIITGELLLTK